MNRCTRVTMLVLAGTGLTFCHKASGVDLGDPVYRTDVGGPLRFEVLYEKYDRKTAISYGDVTYTQPSRTVVVPGSDQSGKLDQYYYMGRLSYLPSDRAALYLDGGAVDDRAAGNTGYIVGGGGRWMAFEKKHIRINVVADGHYVPSYDASGSGVNEELGPFTYTSKPHEYEIGGGVVVSGDAVLDPKTRLEPYGGLLYSALRRYVEDGHTTYPDSATTATYSNDVQEDQALVAVAGISLIFEKNFSVRFEGRMIGDTSYSAALGAAF